jgi:S-adenosylmethionine hydrolase|nr:MAG: hypothetical protein DIU52_06120 [bacterium]
MEPTSRDNGSRSGKPKAVTRITLLTDFGTADGYVAAMKGVIAARAPGVVVDDASHDVPPGDVAAAAWTLSRYWNLYPPGTVHVVVVDPGVGSERRALAAEVDGRLFVAPDNGVLTWVLAEAGDAAVVAIEAARLFRTPVSATFHGRDVFAPVAAELARRAGAGPSRFREVLADLGPEVADPVRLPLPRPHRGPDHIAGEVIHVDRFGNLITNVPGEWLAPGARIRVAGGSAAPLVRTYADVAPGALAALVGSAGMLEVSVRDGSAAERLGVGRGASVRVEPGA